MPSISYVHIASLAVNDFPDKEFDQIKTEVCSWGVAHSAEMRPEVYRKHVLGHWLAYNTLKSFGVTGSQVKQITSGSFGKPFIPGHPVFFNISHSGDLIACVATDKGEIGIDIEQIRPVDWIQYEDCFSLLEWRNISFANDSNRRLLELWTKKESLLKADGRGLQVSLKDVIIEDGYGTIRGENKKWYFKEVPLPGYICNLCAEFEIEKVTVA